MAVVQVVGTIISAGLPIVTTYFTSLMTSTLADANTNQHSTDSHQPTDQTIEDKNNDSTPKTFSQDEAIDRPFLSA